MGSDNEGKQFEHGRFERQPLQSDHTHGIRRQRRRRFLHDRSEYFLSVFYRVCS